MDTEVKRPESKGQEARSRGEQIGGRLDQETVEQEAVDPDSAAPRELLFDRVPWGHSKTVPLTIGNDAGVDHDLEVVSPPLAPFSVVERRPANRVRPDGRRAFGHRTKTLWIRYDATSAMASDVGRVVVGDPIAGRTWTVTLRGSGELATN